MTSIICPKMIETKRQVLPSGLWVVATPIGNLGDMPPRAQLALEQADLILCEDTRRTSVLLSALGLSTFTSRMERLDAHTPEGKIRDWVEKLKLGKCFALVTDAGTPSISDPGAALVGQARLEGVRITPFPGPSAVLTLLSVSGFNETAFTFRGFFPRKHEEQKSEFKAASESNLARVYVWFESPFRILETLLLLSHEFPDIGVVVGKELTKLHEKLFYGHAVQAAQFVGEEIQQEGTLGEWCFAVQFPKKKHVFHEQDLLPDENLGWVKAIRCLLGAGVTPSDTARLVSQEFGIPKRMSYETVLKTSHKK